MNLTTQLLDFVNREASLDPTTQIELETDLLLTGLVDSLGVIRVVQWLEDELEMMIDPVDVILENFQTVARMIDFVELQRVTSA
jgi:acyl carrier protein